MHLALDTILRFQPYFPSIPHNFSHHRSSFSSSSSSFPCSQYTYSDLFAFLDPLSSSFVARESVCHSGCGTSAKRNHATCGGKEGCFGAACNRWRRRPEMRSVGRSVGCCSLRCGGWIGWKKLHFLFVILLQRLNEHKTGPRLRDNASRYAREVTQPWAHFIPNLCSTITQYVRISNFNTCLQLSISPVAPIRSSFSMQCIDVVHVKDFTLRKEVTAEVWLKFPL